MSAAGGTLAAPRRIGSAALQRAAAAARGWPLPVKIAAAGLAILLLAAFTADLIRPLDDTAVDLGTVLQAPSWAHPMGTDEVGRDVLTRVMHGMRVSFLIAGVAALTAVVVGGLIGVLAGTMGGKVDAVIMRLTDVIASQNHFLLGILIVVLFKPALGGAGAIMLSVGITHWPALARIVRGEIMSVRERPFVAAAVGGGANRMRLARRHYLPHVMPAMGLAFVLTIPHAIYHESALSFLGLGLPPHQASLGNILSDSERSLLVGGWWIGVFPGLAILVAAMTIGTLAEHWREHLHPRWRSELEL